MRRILFSFIISLVMLTDYAFAAVETGSAAHGFRRISSEYIGAIESEAVLMEHVPTGARLLYVSREDEEKVFGISFRTPAEDDTGVNHIIEHAVLNGSERFPSSRIFTHILNNSMSTYLNAMTSRDFTTYVFSDRNEEDYRNLMRVYMDGVFFPKVLTEENIFRQEGWRLEVTPDNTVKYNGVVYNEMKGVYSNYEAYLLNAIQASLYPGTPYEYDAGGKPEAITSLSHERLKQVYLQNYQPKNALIFLYGKQDLEATLKILDGEFLSKLPRAVEKDGIDHKARVVGEYGGGGDYETRYPTAGNTGEEKSYMAINYSLCQAGDVKTDSELMFVTTLLARGGDSPVERAVRALGVCDNVYAIYDNDMNRSTMSIVLEGVDLSKKELIEETVGRVMEDSGKNGFSRQRLNAVAGKMEFGNRNIWNLSGAGIKMNRKAIHCFTYGDDILKEFKARLALGNSAGLIENRRVKELIGRYFVENERKSVVILRPEAAGTESGPKAAQKATEEQRLTAENFSKWQAESQRDTDNEDMPCPAVSDLGEKPTEPDYFTAEKDGVAYSHTRADTNGIVGISYYFDASRLPGNRIGYAKLLADMTGTQLGVGGLSREELRSDLNLHAGEFYSYLSTNAQFTDGDVFSPKYVIGLKTLERNLVPATRLLNVIVLDTRIDRKEYVREFVVGCLSNMERRLHDDAPKYAAYAGASESGRYEEQIWGYGYYEFLTEVLKDIDGNWQEVSRKLTDTKEALINKNGLLVSVTGSDANYSEFLKTTPVFIEQLNDRVSPHVFYSFPAIKSKMAFVSPTTYVNYVYRSGNYKKTGGQFNGAMLVAEGILNFDYLWPKIRDEGGAYGSRINISSDGTVILRSYRDPNIGETLKAYDGAVKFLKNRVKSGKDLEGIKANRLAFFDEFYRMENFWDYGAKVYFGTVMPEKMQKIRREILIADPELIKKCAETLEAALNEEVYSVSGSASGIAEEAALFEEVRHIGKNQAIPKFRGGLSFLLVNSINSGRELSRRCNLSDERWL